MERDVDRGGVKKDEDVGWEIDDDDFISQLLADEVLDGEDAPRPELLASYPSGSSLISNVSPVEPVESNVDQLLIPGSPYVDMPEEPRLVARQQVCGYMNHSTATRFGGQRDGKLVKDNTARTEVVHAESDTMEAPAYLIVLHEDRTRKEIENWMRCFLDALDYTKNGLLNLDSAHDPEPLKGMTRYFPDCGASSSTQYAIGSSQEFQTGPPLHVDHQDVAFGLMKKNADDGAAHHASHISSVVHDKPATIHPFDHLEDNCRGQSFDSKIDPQCQSEIQKCSLVLPMAGAHRKDLHNEYSKILTTLMPHFTSVGLRHDSLATVSNLVNIEDRLPSGKNLTCMPYKPFHHPNGQETPSASLTDDADPVTCTVHDLQTLPAYRQDNAVGECDDQNQCIPKKKRCKVENANDSEGCKGCNCKKSRCLKLYCECFAAGKFCSGSCTCQACHNKSIYEDLVDQARNKIKSRNYNAFVPKVVRVSELAAETGEEAVQMPFSARHKWGCNCKKSRCLKKYCECFQGGAGCSISCRCVGCNNTYGRKEVSIGAELGELEQKESTDVSKNNQVTDRTEKQKNAVFASEGPCSSNQIPIVSTQMLSCNGTPLQPLSFGSIAPNHPTTPRRKGTLQDLKLGQHFQFPRVDENLETLQNVANGHPICGVKITSPNSKRITPPPAAPSVRKCSRKLILDSIPSFCSLALESEATAMLPKDGPQMPSLESRAHPSYF